MSKDKIEVNMNVYDIPIVIEELEKAEDTIRKLQKENQQLKKQKDDVVEYIKYQLSNLDFEKDEDMKAKMLGSMILVMLEDKRMLGEIENER